MIKKFQRILSRLKNDRLFFLRFICLLICLDFVSFLSLSSISIIHFWNPLHFLKTPAVDERPTLELFYPTAFTLNGTDNAQGGKRALIKVPQKVHQDKKEKDAGNVHLARNIEWVIQELVLGGDNIRVREAIKSKNIIRYLWVYRNELIVHLDQQEWEKVDPKEKNTIRESIRSSVMENFSRIKKVRWAL